MPERIDDHFERGSILTPARVVDVVSLERRGLVHADIAHQDVIFLGTADPVSSPMKAKGVAELGICGVAAAVANAIHNATGVRVRDYPITLDKLLERLPDVASERQP
jgi:hypothetical protein